MTAPDLIVHNAVVYTADRNAPTASAFAVTDGVLAAVGDAEVLDLAGDGTELIDLQGGAVVPGLVDVHNHHLIAGETDLTQFTFPPTASFAEVVEAVREYAAGLPADAWVVGESFGSTLIEAFSYSESRRRIDDAASGRPVMLTDDSHHNKFANTAALAAAGIDDTTPDPEGGRIVRDPDTNEPTGLLYESATLPLTEAFGRAHPRRPEDYQRFSARGVEILSSLGITAFQDAAVTVDIMEALHALDTRGELDAWVVSSMLSSEFLFADTIYGAELVERGEQFRSDQHRPDFVKVALDGVPPTRTAAFLTPYLTSDSHPHKECGVTTMPAAELADWLVWTAERGLGAKIHCTGDAAVRVALDAIQVSRESGHRAVKYQIAHGQFVHPDDLARFATLDVSADISPYLWFPGVIPESIATVRPAAEVAHMQPNRALLDLGVVVAGGSDWPVSVSPNPWEGIQGLITRRDPLGRAGGVLWAEQAVTPAEALEMFTINGARAMGLDETVGSLTPGKSADFVLLDQDPFAVPVDQIINTHVLETWFRGRRVYQRP